MSFPIFRQIPLIRSQRLGFKIPAFMKLVGGLKTLVLGTVLCGALMITSACEDPQQTQTQAFEYAEEHYRGGQYDAALDGYQAFLESYPTSPLAATAEMRIRGIHREVRSVMMEKNVPRPQYVGKTKKAKPSEKSLSDIAADADAAPTSERSDSSL